VREPKITYEEVEVPYQAPVLDVQPPPLHSLSAISSLPTPPVR
jgi:hypothetical protein